MRVLVTGADGFVGRHLTRALLGNGHAVLAVGEEANELGDVGHEGTMDWLGNVDLRDQGATANVVRAAEATAVVHLAARSSVGGSFKDPRTTYDTNVFGTSNLLTALCELEYRARPSVILLVGSGEQYGPAGEGRHVFTEDDRQVPMSPYAASKVAQEYLAIGLEGVLSSRLVYTRSFLHAGPGQRPPFVLADWAAQLWAISDGRAERKLNVGNLNVVRDITDVRDVVAAYLALLENEDARGPFNVCCGKGVALGKLLEHLTSVAGVEVDIHVQRDRLRPTDLPFLVGSPDRLERLTGWSPTRNIETTLQDLYRDVVEWQQGRPNT